MGRAGLSNYSLTVTMNNLTIHHRDAFTRFYKEKYSYRDLFLSVEREDGVRSKPVPVGHIGWPTLRSYHIKSIALPMSGRITKVTLLGGLPEPGADSWWEIQNGLVQIFTMDLYATVRQGDTLEINGTVETDWR